MNNKSQGENSNDENFYERVGALLDHYSSRAVAHASFLVASIFGLVTFSAMIQQSQQADMMFLLLSMLLFLVLSYMGYYTLIRFGYYANLAERLAREGCRQDEIMKTLKLEKELKKRSDLQKGLLVLRKFLMFEKSGALFLFSAYWFSVLLLGLVTYLRFSMEYPVGWIVLMLWIVFVLIPFVYPIIREECARNSKKGK